MKFKFEKKYPDIKEIEVIIQTKPILAKKYKLPEQPKTITLYGIKNKIICNHNFTEET